jgi:hypothetical protein
MPANPPLSDVVPTIALKHLLDHQGIDIQHAYLQQVQRQHAPFHVFLAIARHLVALSKKMNPLALFQSSTPFHRSLISRRSSTNWK